MNNVKAASLIVLMCVIVPVMVGFVWPSSESTETVYTIGESSNITQDIPSGDVGIYTDFTDLFANNNNQYVDMSGYYLLGVRWNESPASGQPALDVSGLPRPTNLSSITVNHVATISDLNEFIEDHQPAGSDVYSVVISPGQWASLSAGGINDIKFAVYYPKSGIFQYYDTSGVMGSLDTPILKFTDDSAGTTAVFQYLTRLGSADYGAGAFTYSRTPVEWYNGYSNLALDMILKSTANKNMDLTIGDYNISIDFGPASITVTDSHGTETYARVLDYSFILLSLDARAGTVSISGLTGINSMTDDYRGLARNTLTLEAPDLEAFTSMVIYADPDAPPYLITRTVSATTSAAGIVDASTPNLRIYDDDDFQISFSAVQMAPDDDRTGSKSFHIRANGATTLHGHIGADGMLTMAGANGNIVVPLRSATFQFIGNTVYLNGQELTTYSNYKSDIKMYFDGSWMLQISIADLDPTEKPVYGWTSGGFGLDITGFCGVGLITSAGSCIATSAFGRRTGSKVALTVITAGLCAAVYLVLMMTNL